MGSESLERKKNKGKGRKKKKSEAKALPRIIPYIASLASIV